MFVKAPPKWFTNKVATSLVFLQIGFWNFETGTLEKIALFFAKAGAFVFGSGLAIVPFLHAGVVTENHWLTEQQFVDALAVAMITPGPVVITVGFMGYLVASFPGASVAAVATFLPCYLFTVIPAPYFKKIAKNQSIKVFVDGITAIVVGALVGAVIVIASKSILDIPTALIAIITILAFFTSKKLGTFYHLYSSYFRHPHKINCMNRKGFLKAGTLAGAATLISTRNTFAQNFIDNPIDKLVDANGNYIQQALPYNENFLETYMYAETMHLHYTFHHGGAVKGGKKDLQMIKKALDENNLETVDYWTKNYPIIFHRMFCTLSSGHI